MRAHAPSVTAQRVAVRRAEHQLVDRPPVFVDPLALSIVGPRAAAAIAAGTVDRHPGARVLRAFVAVRSRFAEDELAQAVGRGVRQYVVLGAGLDTFAYRNPYPGLQVFEVDHPATQEWKRERLTTAGIAAPASVTFAPVDFERQTLADGLARAGYARDDPAFFSWLGVTPYLAPETVLSTLRLIHTLSAANAVAFDYAVPRASLNWMNRMALDSLSSRVARAGEPFQGFFDPDTLVADLRAMGYAHVETLDAAAINARYFAGRTDSLRVRGGIGRLMCARG